MALFVIAVVHDQCECKHTVYSSGEKINKQSHTTHSVELTAKSKLMDLQENKSCNLLGKDMHATRVRQ